MSQLIDYVPEGEDLGNEGNEENLNKNCLIFLNKSCTGTRRKLIIQAKKNSERFAITKPKGTLYMGR